MDRNFLVENIRKFGLPLLLVAIFILGTSKPVNNLKRSENFLTTGKSFKGFDTASYFSEFLVSQNIEDSISLDSLTIAQRKKAFLNMMLPAVLAVKAKMDFNRQKVLSIEDKKELSPLDKKFLKPLEKKYKTGDLNVLSKRLRTFPVSIVLAQAALESGWGTSRFFRDANNPFGMWALSGSHAKVEALSSRDGKKIYLRKFDNLQDAVEAYYMLLATGRTFQDFRNMKMETDKPLKLIHALDTYSERGSAYVSDLANVIVYNNLQKYDHYQIGPSYLAEEIR